MKVTDLISCFQRMLSEHWAYEWGAAREGVVDCSGAFVWAFKQFEQSIYHGSNTIARKYISGNLRPASEAKPGWAVFKQCFDGEEPTQYKSDGLGDFYHIGLLDADGVSVLNAKGVASGFSSDPIGKWQYAAPLKGVEYEEETQMNVLYTALVNTQSDPLRVREAPVTGRILGTVPKGGIVSVLKDGDWPRVRYNELVGYASGEYLQRVEIGGSGASKNATDGETSDSIEAVTIPRTLAEQLYAALGEAMSID